LAVDWSETQKKAQSQTNSVQCNESLSPAHGG